MQDKKLRIFISHRHEDITICEKIKGILAERAAGKIEFLFAPENIADGQEWYRWIRDNAPNADIFLFIYTKPSLRWDWALFETGMFEAITKTNSHTFICLHSPKLDPLDLPEPVKILQTRPATAEKVVEWLRWLFGETHDGMEGPINADYAKGESVRDEALKISELITKQAIDTGEIETRLRDALVPEMQRVLRSGLRLGFFFRWCVAEPHLNKLIWAKDNDAEFWTITADLTRDIGWVHDQGNKEHIAFLNFLEANLEHKEYQQIRIIFDRWAHHSKKLLSQIEQDRGGERNREDIIASLQHLLKLNKFFMAVFATAMTRLIRKEKPAFEELSDGIEIGPLSRARRTGDRQVA